MDDTYEPILLSRLLCHPNSLRTLNEDRIPELLGEIEALRVHLWSKLTTRAALLEQEAKESSATRPVESRRSEPLPDLEPLLTVDQAAKILSLPPHTVKKMIRAGSIASVKLGKAVRIEPGELREYIEQHPGKRLS